MTNSHARTPWTDRQRREPCPRVNKFFFDQKLITGRDSGLYWLLRFGVLVGTDRHSELRFRDLA
jgi:hypothetical protein